MAGEINVEITRSDGTRDSMKVPAFALESTSKAILKEIAGTGKSTGNIEKLLKAYLKDAIDVPKILGEIEAGQAKQTSQDKKQHDEDTKDRDEKHKEQVNKLEELGKAFSVFETKLLVGVTGLATVFAGTVGALAGHTMALGGTVAELAKAGVGFTATEGSVVNTINSLNQLGLSTADAAQVLEGYAGVMATQGRSSFAAATKELSKITKGGSELGLTMGELVGIYAEDMDQRRTLGIIDQLDAARSAKQTKELYQKQLEYTSRLGIAIEELQGASEETVNSTNFLLTIQATAGRMGAQAAEEMLNAVKDSMADLRASGMSQDLINMMGDAASGPAAMLTEGGQQLFQAFQMMGGEGAKQAQAAMDEYSRAIQSGDPDAVAAATEKMKGAMASMGDRFSQMAPAQQQQLKLMANGNPALQGLINSAIQGKMALANENKERAEQAKQLEEQGKKYGSVVDSIAKTSKAYQQAMNEISGATDMAFNAAATAFQPLMQGFADSLSMGADGSMGAMQAFSEMMTDIAASFTDAMGLAGGDVKDLGSAIRQKLVPILQGVGEWFKDGGMKTIMNAFRFVGGALSGIATVFISIFDAAMFVVDVFGAIGNAISATTDFFLKFFGSIGKAFGWTDDIDAVGKTISDVVPPITSFGKAIGIAVGSLMVFSMGMKAFKGIKSTIEGVKDGFGTIKDSFGKVMGRGGAASTAASSAQGGIGGAAADAAGGGGGGKGKGKGMLSSLGKGIGDLGKGIGKGLGGIISGVLTALADGLSALGTPKVLLGVATLGGLGLAMNYAIAPGFKAFADLDWDTIGKAFLGLAGLGAIAGVIGLFAPTAILGAAALGAIGLALNLFPTDVLEALGPMFTDVFNGIGTVVKEIGGVITGTIDSIANGIAKVMTAGDMGEVMKMEAQTVAIERLSAIPSEKIIATADAIKLMSSALASLGQSVGDDGKWYNPFDDGGGVDVEKQQQQIELFNQFGSIDTNGIIAATTALDGMVSVYSKFASLDATKLTQVAQAMRDVKSATQPDLAQKAMDTVTKGYQEVKSVFKNFFSGSDNNDTEVASDIPRPDQDAIKPNEAVVNLSQEEFNRMDPAQKEMINLLMQIVSNTAQGARNAKRTASAINNLPV